jgi:mono/diheme cytochrome c family protein
LRIQLPSPTPTFFHLDEVEVYAAGDTAMQKNLALGQPANQSSRSPWSRGGDLATLGSARIGLAGKGSATVVTLNGKPLSADRAKIVRGGRTTSVEAALSPESDMAGFPAEVTPFHGSPTPLAAARDWQIVWPARPNLGFGKNRLALELRAAKRLAPPLVLSVETVVLTPQGLRRQVVLQKGFEGPAVLPVEFEISHEGAAAVIVSAGQGKGQLRHGRTFFVAPLRETLDRADRLAAEFRISLPAAELRARADALIARERTGGCDPEARKSLYREARWLTRRAAFANPRVQFDKLLFLKRFTQEAYPDVCLNHMPWVSRPGGDICILSLAGSEAEGKLTTLLNGRLGPGHVHGIDLRWDAERIVFGYAKAKSNEPPPGWLDRRTNFDLRRSEEPTHLFEIGADGRALRQLTRGEWSDLDPTYCPSGEIVFVSERCGYSLQCNEYDKDETSTNLYVMRPDGANIRRMSVTKDGDYLPHALDDGTIGYTRWEYQERGWAHIQSLWTIRPDGTGADALFKQHLNNPWAVEDCRSIPGSNRFVGVAAGHHTLPAGPVIIINPRDGMNSPGAIRIVTPGVLPPEGGMTGSAVLEGGVMGTTGYYMQPWPLSETTFLVSYGAFGHGYGLTTQEIDPAGYGLYLIDVYGTKELLYRDPAISSFYPIPLRPRPRPPILPDVTDARVPYATCSMQNVAKGAPGIRPSQVKYIRIAQGIAWPYCNTFGGQRYEPDVKSIMINWNPVRVLGDVPVEADGSAHFRVPVDTAVYFQLLDADHMELRRMRSFISFQPGEVRACVGCHETREESGATPSFSIALAREPSIPAPPPWGDKPISFLRDVQPVFDKHCAACHGGLKPAAGLDFSGGLTARHNRAYDTIYANKLVAWSNVAEDARITMPLEFGSHRSKLVEVLRSGACSKRAGLSSEDWLRLVTWIDANAPYHDGFINKRLPQMPYDLGSDAQVLQKIAAVHAKRCAECHDPAAVSRLDWIDLARPEQSRFLTAPLAATASGLAKCGKAVYRDPSDPDYRTLRQLVDSVVRKARQFPRRDVKGLLAVEDKVGSRPQLLNTASPPTR